ncbi:hypothetical protein C1645_744580 [Glomus cerebriforme]|uniref:Uncharacterized protein n=1 Tax=Glomus cerebriforme TaxID=658196 RepID=A0A397SBH0_9GLOM|nr:hypothetical protein C1645_744580 [Glomus cerebriforme]
MNEIELFDITNSPSLQCSNHTFFVPHTLCQDHQMIPVDDVTASTFSSASTSFTAPLGSMSTSVSDPHVTLSDQQRIFIDKQKQQYTGYYVISSSFSPFLSIPYTTQVQYRRDHKKEKKAEKRRKERAANNRVNTKLIEAQRAYQAFISRFKPYIPTKRPPLISIQNAFVGYKRKRNFTRELIEEAADISRSRSDQCFINTISISKKFSDILMDLQDNYHAYMNNSPINTLTRPVPKFRKQWLRSHQTIVLTLDELKARFIASSNSITSPTNALNRVDRICLLVFKDFTYKCPSPSTSLDRVIKHTRLLME